MATRQDLNRYTLDVAATVAGYEHAELYVVSVWEAIAEDFMRAGVVTPTEGSVDHYVDSVNRRYQANMYALMIEAGVSGKQSKLPSTMVQSVLLKGAPRKKIPEFAEEIGADLMVMGTVARTGISGLIMGNTAETILNELQCSVLAVKPPGFISPVKLDD
jgi:nucleotide-binding universal stress UspA family protein